MENKAPLLFVNDQSIEDVIFEQNTLLEMYTYIYLSIYLFSHNYYYYFIQSHPLGGSYYTLIKCWMVSSLLEP